MRAIRRARNLLWGKHRRAAAAELLPTAALWLLTAAEWLVWNRWAADSRRSAALLFAAALAADRLLLSPLRLGRLRWFAALAGETPASWRDILYFFRGKAYGRALAWGIGSGWRSLIAAAVCGFPAALTDACCRRMAAQSTGDVQVLYGVAAGVRAALWLTAALVWAVWRVRLWPASLRIAEGAPVRRSFAEGRRRLRGQYSGFLSTLFGETGWGVLAAFPLTCGYAAPLLRTAVCLQLAALPEPVPQPKRQRRRYARQKKPSAPANLRGAEG